MATVDRSDFNYFKKFLNDQNNKQLQSILINAVQTSIHSTCILAIDRVVLFYLFAPIGSMKTKQSENNSINCLLAIALMVTDQTEQN